MNGDPVRNMAYLCFTRDTREEAAAASYTARFGHPPEYIFEFQRMLWLGPIQKGGDDDTQRKVNECA